MSCFLRQQDNVVIFFTTDNTDFIRDNLQNKRRYSFSSRQRRNVSSAVLNLTRYSRNELLPTSARQNAKIKA
jgi:hypothetical protein